MAEAKKSLNTAVTAAVDFLDEKGHFVPGFKWEWQDTREIAWRMVRNEVLPELGINPDSDKPEDRENLANARAAFDKAFSDGYTLESSNLGKHIAANGYFEADAEKAAKARYV